MLNVTQKVYNDIAENYPIQSEAIQKLFKANKEECNRLYDCYWKQVKKQLPENLNEYAEVILDALILTVAHKEIRMYINENPDSKGVLPITETIEQAMQIMFLGMTTPDKVKNQLVAEAEKLLEIIN